MYYSYKGGEPGLIPGRIRLSNGLTRTDKTTFTEEEISDAGYTVAPIKPAVSEMENKILWNSEKLDWDVVPLTEQELQELKEKQWATIRSERDTIINNMEWRINRYHSEVRLGLTPTDDITKIDEYIQALRDITKHSDPFKIEWPEFPNSNSDIL
jgi:hypothetical protein